MTEEPVSKLRSGVVCLFCGARTPGPAFAGLPRWSHDAAEPNFRVSLIRCHRCGKEAPYSSAEIIRYEETPKAKHSSSAA